MITHLHLKLGSSLGQPPLAVETSPSVTIFVGPNNSGKSQCLRELFAFCQNGDLNAARLILEKLTFANVDSDTVQKEFDAAKQKPNIGETVDQNYSILKIGTTRNQLPTQHFLHARISPNDNLNTFTSWYLTHFTLNLDGPSRIGLVNPQSRGDLKHPSTPLGRLLTDDSKRTSLRKVIYDAIGLYFAIDASEG